jgi:RNA polymerase sigma-70 factor (ECF subfamily)
MQAVCLQIQLREREHSQGEAWRGDVAESWDPTMGARLSHVWLRGLAGMARIGGGALENPEGAARLEEQVAEVFDLLRDPIHRYLCRMIGRRPEVEDLTQEAFLRLYDRLRRGEGTIQVRPWLYRVAHNLAIDWVRAEGRHESVAGEEREGGEWSQVIDNSPSVEQRLISEERHRLVWRAVAQLSPQQRHCLYLRAEGLGYREIAEVLNISISSVSTFLGRGIRRISEEMYER